MSLIDYRFATAAEEAAAKSNQGRLEDFVLRKEGQVLSEYSPSDEAKKARETVVRWFGLGDLNQRTPRFEFNDLSLLGRCQVDRMAWNNYMPNDGDPNQGDITQAWRSNAQRPIVHNQVIAIAAHASARMMFPKVFAYDQQNDAQTDAAQVMEDLMEWSGDQSKYSATALMATISALVEPASIVFTEYAEAHRTIKTPKKGGGYDTKIVVDEALSCFRNSIVPCEELYISNPYEPDIQKQDWLIWRRVRSFDIMNALYGQHPDFQYVKPGVQVIYDDADRLFYEVYDQNMRGQMCEEVIAWNRSLDLKLTLVNGILICDPDNPNPRNDKLYPFAKFLYEPISPNFFWGKALVTKISQDAKVINSLYQMVMDGTYLRLMPPMVSIGNEAINADILVPGSVSTLTGPNAQLTPLLQGNDLTSGFNAMLAVEKSIVDSSGSSYIGTSATQAQGKTAYETGIIQQNTNILLNIFVQPIGQFAQDYGRLVLGDILQYLTIVEATQIDKGPSYRAFLLADKESGGKRVSRKIQFDGTLPDDKIPEGQADDLSYETMDKEGGLNSNMEIYRVNPALFRNLKYMITVNPDVKNPLSEELDRQMSSEVYDRLVANPTTDLWTVTRDFVLKKYPQSKRDPDQYKAQAPNPAMSSMMPGMGAQGGAPLPTAPALPTNPVG